MTVSKLFIIQDQKAFLAERLFVLLLCAVLFMSCSSKKNEKVKINQADTSSVYYPINSYIRQQIKDVDTTPYYLYRLSVASKIKDSSVADRATFDAVTKQFLLPQLEENVFKKNFDESVFDDESTNSITLTYAPKLKDNIVQNASVLLDKQTQQVKWIFISTISFGGDSTLIQRIGWKSDESCYINKVISHKGKPETQTQLSFVWNEKEE